MDFLRYTTTEQVSFSSNKSSEKRKTQIERLFNLSFDRFCFHTHHSIIFLCIFFFNWIFLFHSNFFFSPFSFFHADDRTEKKIHKMWNVSQLINYPHKRDTEKNKIQRWLNSDSNSIIMSGPWFMFFQFFFLWRSRFQF